MESIGANTKLSLTGRPRRPIGGLGTSRLYRSANTTMMLYPNEVDLLDFYISLDMLLLIDHLRVGEGWEGRQGWMALCSVWSPSLSAEPAAVHLPPLEPRWSPNGVPLPQREHLCVSCWT